jgi:hypothetical protein
MTSTDSWTPPQGSSSGTPGEPEPTQAIHTTPAPSTTETTSPDPAEAHPLDDPRSAAYEDEEPQPRSRALGGGRHFLSIVLCLIAVIGAYGAVDYGFYRANVANQADLLTGPLPDMTMVWLGVAGGCLLVAALCARISALGPLFVGLVLGAAPTAWVFLDFSSFVHRLDDLPEIWNNTTFGLSYVSFAIFPVVAGALIGAAFAGRWRKPLKKSDLA